MPRASGFNGLNVVRIFVHVFATISAMLSIGFAIAAIMTSGWQIMVENGTGEVHQHGLWFDYTRSNLHLAGAPAPHLEYYEHAGYGGVGGGLGLAGGTGMGYEGYGAGAGYGGYGSYGYGDGYGLGYGTDLLGQPYYPYHPGMTWIMTYKFGDAVYGDAVHAAQYYQINCLILMVISILLGVAGLLVSYCAAINQCMAITWAVFYFLATILSASGLIQFYINALLPEYRFVFTDRKIQQIIGYSFYWGVVGSVGLMISTILAVIVDVVIFLIRRRGDRVETAAYTFYGGGGGGGKKTAGNPTTVYEVRRSVTPV